MLLTSSLLTTPMGLAADQHTHHGDMGEASAEKVIYREGGAVLHDRMMEEVKRQQESIGQKGGYSPGANSHMLQQGVLLVTEDPTKVSVNNGQRCPATAPVKDYHVSAINIEITLSRFLDYFPGYMYVLKENVEKARGEEVANREAREKENDPGAVSNGLQGDVIQPLVIRANQGDCLKLTLHNEIPEEPTNLVINGSSMVVAATGKPATPSNPEGTVASGGQQSFEWYIKPETQEGVRFFRSHASREQFNQGLIGMLVVEPRGSRYLSPFDGTPMASGWEAMIEDPKGADFREFAIFYHEAGDEAFRLLNKKGEMLPQRDPHTDSYRPGARLLNYRSEPHGTRIELQAHMGFYGDESMAYGSYTFGDPATTVPRSYLGDPAKFRMAGGSEIVHSHHLHGGSIRWARQPGNSNLDFALSKNGPVKFPAISDPSDRLDVQSIGPTEVYDQVIEGGSGGLQALAGEFVFHCHIPQHYVTGMWGFWRVYNSLQQPGFQTDVMKPLVELPDRVGKIKTGTPSDKLVGTTVDWYGGKKYEITKDKTDWKANPVKVSIKDWVEMMLTPQGKPGKKNS
ncbi:MAG: multicopper oxidase domain-containing protein, partial [Nitrospiraceae bacterium]